MTRGRSEAPGRRARVSAWAIVAIIAGPAAQAWADEWACESVDVFVADEVRSNTALFQSLLYNLKLREDADGMKFLVKSEHHLPGYQICVRLQAGPKIRHGCYSMYDKQTHSIQTFTPEEMRQIDAFVAENFDVRGRATWNGQGQPPGTLSHQRQTCRRVKVHSLPLGLSASAASESRIRRAISSAARSILFCAHPSGKYESVEVERVHLAGQLTVVDFTIDYRCTVIERPCRIKMRAGFEGLLFRSVEVLSDTAATDAKIGLQLCGALIHALSEL